MHKNKGLIYLIDYGLVKRYVTGNGIHIPYCERKRMIGTLRYSSVNSQLGYEQSRRDDLESLGYCLIYMLKGRLPWQGTEGATREERYHKILHKKQNTAICELCRGLPMEMRKYMHACNNLKFEEKPAYCDLHKLFDSVLKKTPYYNCFTVNDFDWNAMNCDLTRRTKKNNENSVKMDCEELCKLPKLNMSRRMEIKNLATEINVQGLSEIKEKSGRKAIIDFQSKEEKKEVNKTSILLSNKLTRTLSERTTTRITKANYKYFQAEVTSNEDLLCNFSPSEIAERIDGKFLL